MYTEILKKVGVKQTPEFTLSILTYEVGKLHQIKVYKERFGSAGFIGDETTELGDAYTMVCLLIEQKGHKVEDLAKEGLERFETRLKEVKLKQLQENCKVRD